MGFGREFLFLFLVNFVSLTIAQPTFLGYFCNYTSTNNSLYQANRDTLLPSLASRTNKYGFYTSSLGGEGPNTLNALSLCRADVDLDTCRQCINNATSKLTQLCPTTNVVNQWSQDPSNKAAIGWYDDCMVRYSNTTMEGIMAGDPRIFVWDTKKNVTSVEQFKVALSSLLNSLRVQAASGGTQRKFASGNATGPDSQTIYALVQCTPDLSQQDCSDCLQGAMDNIPLCCDGPAGGRVIRPSCNFRYEIGPFFGEIPGDGNKTRTAEVPKSSQAEVPESSQTEVPKSSQAKTFKLIMTSLLFQAILSSFCILIVI